MQNAIIVAVRAWLYSHIHVTVYVGSHIASCFGEASQRAHARIYSCHQTAQSPTSSVRTVLSVFV